MQRRRIRVQAKIAASRIYEQRVGTHTVLLDAIRPQKIKSRLALAQSTGTEEEVAVGIAVSG